MVVADLVPDIILVRMVADPTKAVEQRVNYRNALHGLYRMVKDEGPTSLARGLAPNTVSISPATPILRPVILADVPRSELSS